MRYLFVFFAATLAATSAWATAQRTFVSHAGIDSNPCSVDMPCRSFAVAIGQTNANGEVVALDSAGYGPVTVTQSATIVAPLGVHAGISVFSGDGVTVNASSTDTIVLRNLYVSSQGGQNGITVASGSTVHIEHCVVAGFVNNNINIDAPGVSAQPIVTISDTVSRGSGGAGIYCNGGLAAIVSVERCRLESNLYGVLAGLAKIGIVDSYATKCNAAFVAGASGPATMAIESCMVTGCNEAVEVDGSGKVTVHNTTASGSASGYQCASGGKLSLDHCVVSEGDYAVLVFGDVSVSDCTIADNNFAGIHVGVGGVARLGGNTITRNNIGIDNAGGTVHSTGDNIVDGNSTDTSGTILAANKA